MKKLLIVGNDTQFGFWNQHICLKDIAFSIFDGIHVKSKIDEFKPDVVIMDEYFHNKRYKDITTKCINEKIKYYILSPEEDASIRKYQLSHDVLSRINENLIHSELA